MDRAPFLDMHDDFWDRVLEVNLGGVFKCGQIAARRMIEQGKGGRIVNVLLTLVFLAAVEELLMVRVRQA